MNTYTYTYIHTHSHIQVHIHALEGKCNVYRGDILLLEELVRTLRAEIVTQKRELDEA